MTTSSSKRLISVSALFATAFAAPPFLAQQAPQHPRITGIDHVRLYVSDVEKSRDFYSKLVGVRPNGGMCLCMSRPCFTIGWSQGQTIELEKKTSQFGPMNWLAEIAFDTDDIEKMRSYLVARGMSPTRISTDPVLQEKGRYDRDCNPDLPKPYDAHFEIRDPEDNSVSFIQRFGYPVDDPPPFAPWYVKILHAGFVVKNPGAENRFYRDLLGFRLYWQGGFKDEGVDWYEIQVPNGNNWIEYMLNIPTDADHAELGVQNHFSLGVRNIHATADQLRKNGLTKFDGPEIGRDGKWSLDVYDPDGTRIEFMEFKPAKEPCCHPYTAEHPKP